MTSKTKLVFLGVCALLLFLFRGYFLKKTPPVRWSIPTEAPVTTEGYRKFKEENKIKETATDRTDEISPTFFKSHIYSFSIRLINNWVSKKGDEGSSIAVQSVQADSAKSMAVIINDYGNMGLSGDVNSDYDKLRQLMIEQMRTSGVEMKGLEFTKGQLDNVPAIISTCKAFKKGGQYDFFNNQILCIKSGRLYDITFSMPASLYNEKEAKRISIITRSFTFL